MRVATVLGAVLMWSLLSASPVWAQDRDRALAAVVSLTETLIEKTAVGPTSDRDVWAGVQGLTDALRRFVLAETEIRAEEKVSPPHDAGLRPGETPPVPATTPGDEVPVSAIPTTWFNSRISVAQAAMETVRRGLEENLPHSELAARLRTLRRALTNLSRPPGLVQRELRNSAARGAK